MRVYEVAEIQVFGEKNTILVQRTLEDLIVRRTCSDFGDCQDVMTRVAQRTDD